MIKTLISAAFATVSLVAVSMPAQAAPNSGTEDVSCDAGYSISDNATSIEQRLEAKGVAVSGVEDWSGCVRAYVTKADGSTGMVILDPIYLTPVNGTTAATTI